MFYLIAFSITWIGWLVMDRVILIHGTEKNFVQLVIEGHLYMILYPFLAIGALWGPLISAFVVYRVNYGKAGSRALLKKVFNWRVAVPWYLAALIFPIAIKYGAFWVNALFLGGEFVTDFERVSALVILLKFFEELVPTGGQEEVGWTGFAQLQLQQRMPVFHATVVKASLGWVWHLPLYLVFPWNGAYGADIWLLLLRYFGVAFVLTWLFNNTDSVLIPALFHASFNTFGANVSLSFTSPENVILTLFLIGVFTFIVVGLAFARYGKNLTKQDLPILEAEMTID